MTVCNMTPDETVPRDTLWHSTPNIFGCPDHIFEPETQNAIQYLATLHPDHIATILKHLPQQARINLAHRWPLWAHPGQWPDQNDWRVWMILAGRGFGKTRAGAEWVSALARAHPALRIALIGATMDDVRRVMVEGESGLIHVARAGEVPVWRASLGELHFPNGAIAFAYSAEVPEKLRGPQHHIAWADELAKWPNADASWDTMMLGLRLGPRPQVMVTTTPQPIPLLSRIMAETGVVVHRGRTQDNVHLPPAFVDQMHALYAGTRLGRQELDGELITDTPGALWTRALLDQCRISTSAMADIALRRIVIGVDPPAGSVSGKAGDACGIIAVGLDCDNRGYVLADHSVHGASPERWARAVAAASDAWGADRVVAEANQGGAMVESVLRAASITLPVRLVHATRGKSARAEPVAALYEAGRVQHAGHFGALEDELCGLIAGGGYVRIAPASGPGTAPGEQAQNKAGKSPDRADALVWALTELMLGRNGSGAGTGPRVRRV